MAGETIKQNNRRRYIELCQEYNAAKPTDPHYVGLSVALHSAKGWDHIPKAWTWAPAVKRFGIKESSSE